MNETRFFFYDQNNTGGSFDVDENVAEYVIIEAFDVEHANQRAQEIGIYFDGCAKGLDCDCCGDRWYPPWDGEGYETEDEAMERVRVTAWRKEHRIHYLVKEEDTNLDEDLFQV
jgi:hypothetical protein